MKSDIRVSIQLATSQDITSLEEVMNRAFDDLSAAYQQNRRGLHNCDMCIFENWADDKQDPNFSLLMFKVLFTEEIIGGFCIRYTRNTLTLNVIFVDPPYQNQGIGSRIIQFITEFALQKKTLKTNPQVTDGIIDLHTPDWAIRNHRFYEKNGFVKVSTRPNWTSDFNDCIYHKTINDEKTKQSR
jgi:GNAT superfamily N-acetyltransferase